MPGTAYIMYEDLPLDSPLWDQFKPKVTREMVIEAALIAYRDGDEASAISLIRAMVDMMNPTSEDAAERITNEIMDVIRTA